MTVIIRNLSEDAAVRISIDGVCDARIDEQTQERFEINGNCIKLSVAYEKKPETVGEADENRVDLKAAAIRRLTESAENAVLRLCNTYLVSGIADGAVVEVRDCAYFVDTNEVESFFKCIPALYYFGAAECDSGAVEIAGSAALNREGFLGFYKHLFRLVNIRGIFFDLIRYKMQLGRQKRISKDKWLKKTFAELYSLPADERDRQFRPVEVIAGKVVDAAKEKIAGKALSAVMDRILPARGSKKK